MSIVTFYCGQYGFELGVEQARKDRLLPCPEHGVCGVQDKRSVATRPVWELETTGCF